MGLRIGVDGHLLCERRMVHPLAGQAVVDCSGLEVDREFKTPTDPGQIQQIEQAAGKALWKALEHLAATWQVAQVDPLRRGQIRNCLLNAVTQTCGPGGKIAQRRGPLLDLTLFEDLSGSPISGRALRAVAAREALRVVDADLPTGSAVGDRLVLRADAHALAALEVLLPGRLERWDEGWRAELAWRHRDQPERVLEGIRERLGEALEQVGTSSELAEAALIGFGRPTGRDLISFLDGWNLNPNHPAFKAAQRLLQETQAEWPDPLFHLAAAIGPVMLSQAPWEAPLALLVQLADQALSAARRAGVGDTPAKRPGQGEKP